MGKVIHKEIIGESQIIIEFESYQDFKDWYKIGSEDVVSNNTIQFNIAEYLEGGGFKDINKLDVNWDDIDPKYKWAAMDLDGDVCVFDNEPSIDNFWEIWDNKACQSIQLPNTPPKEFWKDTLTKRPEVA